MSRSHLVVVVAAALTAFVVVGCAKSSAPTGRDGGTGVPDASPDSTTPSDTGTAPDTTVVGPSCGAVVCDVFERCSSGACVPYAACVVDSECEASEICRNRYCIDRATDIDGDGVTAETDCDESNPLRYPGATETCDTVDEDCDEAVDEDVTRACMTACGAGTESCVGGAFVGCDAPPVGTESCNGADDDCDGATDEALSRACSTACGAGTETCSMGSWVMCDAPPTAVETCNLTDDDCDGACDEMVGGCRAPVHRSYQAGTGEHFYTTSRAEAACCGFTVEFYDFFYLYASSAPGLVPFYRCVLASGFHFYTQSSSCEGSPGSVSEGVMGYVATTAGVCGSVPLYRLVRGNDHFYTTSVAERDSAIAVSGYASEGVAAHVWPSS
jgi:hypothetical protein